MAPTRLPLSDLSNNRQTSPGGKKSSQSFAASAPKPCKLEIPFKRRKETKLSMSGPWTRYEHLAFLQGLRVYGPSNWKMISKLIPTRDNVQVKSHGQQQVKKLQSGINIFEDLEIYIQEQKNQQQVTGAATQMNYWQQNHLLAGAIGPPVGFRAGFGMAQTVQHSRKMQPMVRPPSEVIEIACTLVELSSTPRVFHVSKTNCPNWFPRQFGHQPSARYGHH